MKKIYLLLVALFSVSLSFAQGPPVTPSKDVFPLLAQAEGYLATMDLKKAINTYNQILQMAPNNAEAYVKRARAYALSGRQSEALADFNKAMQINPYIADLHGYNGGQAQLRLLSVNYKEAIENYGDLLCFADYEESFCGEHIQDLLNEGNYQSAIIELDSILLENPFDTIAIVKRAITNIYLGALEEAETALRIVIDMNEESSTAYNLL
jgi:tetratricopeptide (TPR) repeat protein